MSSWPWPASFVALLVATYVAAVNLALLDYSPSALHRRLAAKGREAGGDRLREQLEPTILAISLLQTFLRVVYVGLVVAAIVGVDEDAQLTWTGLIVSSLIAVVLLWLCSSVLARAIAKYIAEGIIARSLPMLGLASNIGRPLSRALSFIDEATRRLSGANLRDNDDHVEEELLQSIEDTRREGGLDVTAATLMGNVVEFSTTDIAEVMTPRTDIDGLELTDDVAAIRSFIEKVGHSRIPVFEGDLDHIVGILYAKDLIPYLGEDVSDFKLRPLLRKTTVFPDTKPVSELLADFQLSEVHMAIVIDEYGGTSGLVTIEDVLEEIVGEIHDEHEPQGPEEPTLTSIDERHVEVDGRFHIDDLNQQLGLELPEVDEYDTVGGFMLARLGRVPTIGEEFVAHDVRFTAIAATHTHVQRVAIELLDEVHINGHARRLNGENGADEAAM